MKIVAQGAGLVVVDRVSGKAAVDFFDVVRIDQSCPRVAGDGQQSPELRGTAKHIFLRVHRQQIIRRQVFEER
ncbi:MAG: hypothetical protein BWX45_00972 [Deltaproteobacteria bacterium ADurb.Bin002]|nr:MAG: hypothetical protein BWX45_00972 [Deltaproteobacteria bacterium ADurb.Bin002]